MFMINKVSSSIEMNKKNLCINVISSIHLYIHMLIYSCMLMYNIHDMRNTVIFNGYRTTTFGTYTLALFIEWKKKKQKLFSVYYFNEY